MECDVCHFLIEEIKKYAPIQHRQTFQGDQENFLELRRLGLTHYTFVHPNPFREYDSFGNYGPTDPSGHSGTNNHG